MTEISKYKQQLLLADLLSLQCAMHVRDLLCTTQRHYY